MNKKLVTICALVALSTLPLSVFAVFNVGNTTQPVQDQEINPVDLINNVINKILWPVAVFIVVVLFIIAGFIYLTAHGEPGKIATANKAVAWGVVGVIVIAVAFSIIATINFLIL